MASVSAYIHVSAEETVHYREEPTLRAVTVRIGDASITLHASSAFGDPAGVAKVAGELANAFAHAAAFLAEQAEASPESDPEGIPS